MELEEAIFSEIVADATLSAKVSMGDGRYRIFPVRVPDGILSDNSLVYTEITQSLTYPLVRSSRFQISCIASTFELARGMANDLDRIFNDYSEGLLGGAGGFGVKYIKFEGRSVLYDEDAKLYVFPVELFIKF